jgi:hypothetical protein
MRKRTVKLWRLHDDGRKLYGGTIEAADPRELVLKWSLFLATAEKGVYFATYRGSFVGLSRRSRVTLARWRRDGAQVKFLAGPWGRVRQERNYRACTL